MVEAERRSLVVDWLRKVKMEVEEPDPGLLSSVKPFPRSFLYFFLVFSIFLTPFSRGWQQFYKAFGDSEKNFSIDAYIAKGFEVFLSPSI